MDRFRPWAKVRGALAFGALQTGEKVVDADLFSVPRGQRTDEVVDSLVRATRHLTAFGNLPVAERYHLARCWSYEGVTSGAAICNFNDENPRLIVVLSGTVVVTEARLRHNLGSSEAGTQDAKEPQLQRKLGIGSSFGQS